MPQKLSEHLRKNHLLHSLPTIAETELRKTRDDLRKSLQQLQSAEQSGDFQKLRKVKMDIGRSEDEIKHCLRHINMELDDIPELSHNYSMPTAFSGDAVLPSVYGDIAQNGKSVDILHRPADKRTDSWHLIECKFGIKPPPGGLFSSAEHFVTEVDAKFVSVQGLLTADNEPYDSERYLLVLTKKLPVYLEEFRNLSFGKRYPKVMKNLYKIYSLTTLCKELS